RPLLPSRTSSGGARVAPAMPLRQVDRRPDAATHELHHTAYLSDPHLAPRAASMQSSVPRFVRKSTHGIETSCRCHRATTSRLRPTAICTLCSNVTSRHVVASTLYRESMTPCGSKQP